MAAVLDVNPLIAALDAAVTAKGVPFGDSNRPSDLVADRPYVVAFFDGGVVTDRTMLSRDGVRVSVALQTYGWSPDAVRVGRRKVVAALYEVVGSVHGGWLVHSPVHQAALPIEREDKTNPPLYWQTDDFTVRLSPA